MLDPRQRELMGMGLDDLLEALASPEPGSVNHEFTKALIQARVAEMQRDSVRWARLTALATAGATLIALAALLVAVF